MLQPDFRPTWAADSANDAARSAVLPHSMLAGLQTEERFRGRYRIDSMLSRHRRDGATFWKVRLTDASGVLTCYGWPESLGDGPRAVLPRHTVVEVEATTRILGDCLVADLRAIDPVAPDIGVGDTCHLVPWASCDKPEVLPRFAAVLEQITIPHLRGFVDRVLANDAVMLSFLRVPASLRYHHAEFGGLLLHSIEVAEIVAGHPVVDRAEREIAIIGALFHDIGKTRTFDHHLKRTDCGNLVCHDHLTLEICAPGLSFLDGVWPEAGLMLRHLWTASNSPNFGIAAKTSLVALIRGADRFSAERAKDELAFRRRPETAQNGRVGEEMRWRMNRLSLSQ